MVTPKIGVLMLNTVFPRLIGDIGREESFSYPVERYYVKGATSKSVVLSDEDICQNFIEGALQLEKNGCTVVTTSCGFLIKYQSKIADKLKIPFVSSSLLLFDMLTKAYSNNKTIGVLTASKNNLQKLQTDVCDITKISQCSCGMDGTYFYDVYVKNEVTDENTLDIKQLYIDLLNKAKELIDNHQDMSAIILECTNMSPFKLQLKQDLGLPVYDVNSLITYILNESI